MNFAKWRDVWKRFSGRGTYPHELFTRLAEALDSEIEWCNRRLLARIHRLTLGRLRREIAPVSTADFMRLLFSWQHAAPSSQLHGVPGALQIIEQLQGYEISAATWERDVLPRRIAGYTPELLDQVCLSGEVMWRRLSPHPAFSNEARGEEPDETRRAGRRVRPTRVAPMAIFLREDAAWLLPGRSSPRRRRQGRRCRIRRAVSATRSTSRGPLNLSGPSGRFRGRQDKRFCGNACRQSPQWRLIRPAIGRPLSRPPVGFEVLLQRHEPLAKRVPFVKPLRLLPAVRVMENGDVFDSKGYYGAPPADPGYADFSTLPWYGNLRSIERARQARAKQAGIDLHKQDVE